MLGHLTLTMEPLATQTMNSTRNKINNGVVTFPASSNPQVISGTVHENITMGAVEQSEKRAQEILMRCGGRSLMGSLGAGLDTRIGEEGHVLSYGESQRICIARTLFREACIYLFDEPTAPLDGPTEHEFAIALSELKQERPQAIALLASHRLSTVLLADWVLVLEQGQLAEQGSPKELWAKGAAFYDLFAEQIPKGFTS
ncbi:MAG: ABC transporter ATP-binding protein [Myxococcales bacterium]|nr:MAG: ABC transporter ATP-binding protein [Myxococcales bacterium]